MSTFSISGDDFVLDGSPHRILSGAMHYFRVHPGLWGDRIRKAKSMGLNTIETYVPWNLHQPTRQSWDWDGMLDLGRYLDLIAAEGMHAIVRPGPYICAEWDNGGLPAWLFADPDVGIRRNEPRFMAAVGAYLDQVYSVVAPRQIHRDGTVILVQVENEYGAYGDDAAYLRALTTITRDAGITVPLTTVDQPEDRMLAAGSLPDLLSTGSFGSRPAERLTRLRRHQPSGPLMCSEFWDGWFDHWGAHHHTTSAERSAADLDALLAEGASVNIYMFHGGTNFGFTSGANDKGVYQPVVTSYDYDAPLDEAGNPTAKYRAFQRVLQRYAAEASPSGVDGSSRSAPLPAPAFTVPAAASVPLLDVLDSLGDEHPFHLAPTIDTVDHTARLVAYRTEIAAGGVLTVAEVRDSARAFLNGQAIGTLARERHDRALTVQHGGELTLLVEDRGRVDYGERLGEPKGLIGPVCLSETELTGWRVRPLDPDLLETVFDVGPAQSSAPRDLAGPAIARWSFEVPRDGDLFLDTTAWGEGIVWLNGFCLGRYHSAGPQRTLYIPAPLLRVGGHGDRMQNDLVVLELRAAADATARFVEHPNLGHTDF